MEIQLRDYRIKPGHMDDWITAWQRGVLPLRRQEGFEVAGAWVDRAHDRFVWLIKYSGADGFQAAEERYHARPERLSLHPEPSDFIQSATLDMVDGVL